MEIRDQELRGVLNFCKAWVYETADEKLCWATCLLITQKFIRACPYGLERRAEGEKKSKGQKEKIQPGGKRKEKEEGEGRGGKGKRKLVEWMRLPINKMDDIEDTSTR